jgi:4a-hydroxytetrahydrobiopterin dehydratase|tara:strand:+ start:105 stop:383 length:279 start_codon:yes stop_codon:yes gene_type:complete
MSAKINKISNIQAKKLAPTWSIKKNKLYKKFIFLNFSDALSFIVQVGIESEKINHHPTISNTYNKVEIWLDTHSVNGLTRLDIKLAERIDNL